MDAHKFKVLSRTVSEASFDWYRRLAEEIKEHLDEAQGQMREWLRVHTNKLEESGNKRDSQVLSRLTSELHTMRQDVQRFGEEQRDAYQKVLEGRLVQVQLEMTNDIRAMRAGITKEIEETNRSIHDGIMSKVRARGGD